MTTPQASDDYLKLYELIDKYVHENTRFHLVDWPGHKELIATLQAHLDDAVLAGKIAGMEKAKSRVLRRTEISADAKNPTRDIVVMIGEECARIIEEDVANLQRQQKDHHD